MSIDVEHPFVQRLIGALATLQWASTAPEMRGTVAELTETMLKAALDTPEECETFSSMWKTIIGLQGKIHQVATDSANHGALKNYTPETLLREARDFPQDLKPHIDRMIEDVDP